MIERLGQIALAVRDLDRSLAFYRDKLQLPFIYRDVNIALFDIGGVRLLLGKDETGKQPADATPFGTTLYYAVRDIEARFAALKKAGVATVESPHMLTRFNDKEVWMAFLKDPDDHVFALIEER